MNKKLSSILYVNFSPYENTGNILDYILENYSRVYLFVFNFHHLGKKQNRSYGKIFINGKLVSDLTLLTIPILPQFVFFLLPVRSLGIFLQLLWYCFQLSRTYGSIETFFTVNAFTSWIGTIAKRLGFVKRSIFWAWDYYPPFHEDKIIMLMRWAYWQFDKIASNTDRVVFLNNRLLELRKNIGILPESGHYPIVSIGTDTRLSLKPKHLGNTITLGFIGVLKKSQGLDLIFDSEEELTRAFPDIRIIIIGAGPDDAYYRRLAHKSSLQVSFYGLLPTRAPGSYEILSQIDIGLALYVPDQSNVSYYGDPSKIKDYLSLGIPVITTNVFEFANTIEKHNAGIIVTYGDKNQLTRAIKNISDNYSHFQTTALSLAKKYDYRHTYPAIFSD